MNNRLMVLKEIKDEEKSRIIKADICSVMTALSAVGTIAGSVSGDKSSALILGAATLIWFANTVYQVRKLYRCHDKMLALAREITIESIDDRLVDDDSNDWNL